MKSKSKLIYLHMYNIIFNSIIKLPIYTNFLFVYINLTITLNHKFRCIVNLYNLGYLQVFYPTVLTAMKYERFYKYNILIQYFFWATTMTINHGINIPNFEIIVDALLIVSRLLDIFFASLYPIRSKIISIYC